MSTLTLLGATGTVTGSKYLLEAGGERLMVAHADCGEILAWLKRLRTAPGKTFLVHGEPRASEVLHQRIAQQFGWDVSVPAYLQKVTL
jgi:metallo-beta-lactamase family protein